MQEELRQQVLQQKESLTEIAEMLAFRTTATGVAAVQCQHPSTHSSLASQPSVFLPLNVSYDAVCSCTKSCLLDCERRSWRWPSMSRRSAAPPSQISLTAQCQLCSNYAGQLCALTRTFQPRLCIAVC